ncbi:hypothetical protein NO1_0253 [Candidatus Termititenax aidoneus]|uniref:Uncharacterized protein n=1 Tax=Termititenax aidoneus TaxID=2218524 RepID=A0A388T821_TERA1|nr:hypothetical protein NO1_0253 [Candidatus Termititenax aidoneus]
MTIIVDINKNNFKPELQTKLKKRHFIDHGAKRARRKSTRMPLTLTRKERATISTFLEQCRLDGYEVPSKSSF